MPIIQHNYTQVICDFCNKTIEKKDRLKNGIIVVDQDLLDHFNQPCDSGKTSHILCDTCLDKAIKALNVIMKAE